MSLIELMISMVVGLFLLAGVVTNFLSTTDNDRMRDAISEMDSTASVVFDALRPAIAHAGYGGINNIRLEKPFYTESDGSSAENTSCGGSDKIFWSGEVKKFTKNIGRKDRVSTISMADNPCKAGLTKCPNLADRNPNALVYSDCTGGGADADDTRVVSCSTDTENGGMSDPTKAKIYNTFYLTENATREFSCQGSRGGDEVIAENVEAIKYLYGVTDNTGKTYYRNATDVEDDDQWGMVTSVQVGLLVRSAAPNLLKTPSTKKKYYPLKAEITIADADLSRLFKVYTTTVYLENINKGALL